MNNGLPSACLPQMILMQDAESKAREASEAAALQKASLETKALETGKLLEESQAKLEDTQVALDTYKQQ